MGLRATTSTCALLVTLLASAAAAATDAGQKDGFGITKKYATAPGGKSWNSQHWADGKPRYITGRDPDDPTGLSESRSDQARLYVDGKGVLQFLGEGKSAEPRLHLNGMPGTSFKNVEITFYYSKEDDAEVDWGGLVVGARSGPDGHSQPAKFCDAHTYYGRIRNDAKWDFEKELKHPASMPRAGGGNIWNGAKHLPANTWIGMKYVVYNVTVAGKPAVKLELYRDVSGGANGGDWQKLGETVDSGGWTPPQSAPPCADEPADFVETDGGVIVLRNTGSIKDSYKWMSVREIVPPA
jgi:hypothetical protein